MVLELLDRPIETSGSELQKNVKSVYKRLDINPTLIDNPKCPPKTAKLLSSKLPTAKGLPIYQTSAMSVMPLKEVGKVMAQLFPRRSLQPVPEHLFSTNGVERLVEQQQVWRAQQDERGQELGRRGHMLDARPGKVYRHQLDDECYRHDGLQRERDCLVLTINVSIDYADLHGLATALLVQWALFSVTPSEPGGCLLPRLLLALVALGVDLLSGECDGLWIKTPGQLCCLGTMPAAFDAFFHLTISYQTILRDLDFEDPLGGGWTYRIGTICCDRLAVVAITGVSHFSKENEQTFGDKEAAALAKALMVGITNQLSVPPQLIKYRFHVDSPSFLALFNMGGCISLVSPSLVTRHRLEVRQHHEHGM
ncbi:hypothetical protein C347_02621 [Cryptococcus neoformans AD2-60a]|nr:hypothetical protein C347_02621 [Cryptococcus neoformans var. grubii AD2-60a]OXC85362.1 hypothetical protein C344_02317 [Cryptococcus neoformans var. grubii AD1-7a]OXH34889.1 hypothetical protein J005_02395 [Cryptococcus neoformans var. grubii]